MSDYRKYLKSYQWKNIKEQVITKVHNKCELCGSRNNLVVHHIKYPKVLGTETLNDLQCLCDDCHNVKCHNGSSSNSKIRLTKQEKRKRKISRQKAKFAGLVRIYSKEEIKDYITGMARQPCT